MKNIILFLLIPVILGLHSCTTVRMPEEPEGPPMETITYQDFYDQLSPYGRWIDYPGYGYVWSPAGPDFKPYYTGGYWGYTNYGWTWISDYPWGWAPFHYGRWFYETGFGWLWVPGYEWAPAWVCWTNSADYYGWAPLAPGMSINIYITINIPYEHWVFVPHRYIGERHFQEHCLDEHANESALIKSTFISNHYYTKNKTIYAAGPSLNETRKFIGEQKPLPVENDPNPGRPTVNEHNIRIFKPPVKPTEGNNNNNKPKEVIPFKDLPHSNGKRGTWTAPPMRPLNGNEKQNNRKFK